MRIDCLGGLLVCWFGMWGGGGGDFGFDRVSGDGVLR